MTVLVSLMALLSPIAANEGYGVGEGGVVGDIGKICFQSTEVTENRSLMEENWELKFWTSLL